MKRHDVTVDVGWDGRINIDTKESSDGEWVRAVEALDELAKLQTENETLRRDANWYADCEGQYRVENARLLAENAVFAAALDSNPFSAGADAIRGYIAEALREMEKP